jgi:hypothetical protein
MNYDHYGNLTYNADRYLFAFDSEGPKGILKKVIAYSAIKNLHNSYNLGFGTLKTDSNGDFYIDDNEISDNGDRNKVLATVAISVYAFIDKYPDKKIYLTGSSKARTRLYQMAINHAYEELSEEFRIFGDLGEIEGLYDLHPFQKGINYNGFLIEKR